MYMHLPRMRIQNKRATFFFMSSHCVPFPEAGAPEIIIRSGAGFASATTCLR